jgi:hypothetical protein
MLTDIDWCKEAARILGYHITKMSPTSTFGNTSVPYYNISNDHNITTLHKKEEIKKYLELKMRESIVDDSNKIKELEQRKNMKRNWLDTAAYLDMGCIDPKW